MLRQFIQMVILSCGANGVGLGKQLNVERNITSRYTRTGRVGVLSRLTKFNHPACQ